jgi:hypothetical protein
MPPAKTKAKPAKTDAEIEAEAQANIAEANERVGIQPLHGSATVSVDGDTQAIGGAEITGRQLASDPILGRRDAPSGHGNPA